MMNRRGKAKLKKLTIGKLCKITGIRNPEISNKIKREGIGYVYSHPDQVSKGSALFVTYGGVEKEHTLQGLRQGATIVFVKEHIKKEYFVNEPKVIGIEDPAKCVSEFLKYVVTLFDAVRVAVTGSVGKTTTVDILKCVIGDSFKMHSHHSMTNSRDGVLRTAQKLSDDTEVYLQEIGGAHPGYVEDSAKGFLPDACVITSINESHLDEYKTIEGILYDKASVERHLKKKGIAVLDLDNQYLRNLKVTHRVIWFSQDNEEADYHAENLQAKGNATEFDIVCKDGSRYPAKINILGDYNVKNALAAFAIGRWLDISPEKIVESMGKFKPSGIRQNLCTIGGYNILLDSFNSSFESLIGSVEALGRIKIDEGGRRVVVMGDIDRLGEKSQQIHWDLGEALAKCNFDILCCYGNDSHWTYENAKQHGVKNLHYFSEREELNQWLRDNITRNDVTLYKSGQLASALAKTVDGVYGTVFHYAAQRVKRVPKDVGNYKFNFIGENLELNGYSGGETHITIPEEVEDRKLRRIGPNTFERNRHLKSVYIPDSVANIGYAAFYVCNKLKEIHLPKGLLVIERSAFNYCKALEKVSIPQGTLHIDTRAFYDCSELEEIYIPDSVGYIGEEAFKNCKKLTIICESGSYAEEYAKENGINCVIRK